MISCRAQPFSKKSNRWRFSGQGTPKSGRAEFLSRPKKISSLGSPWSGPKSSFAWSDSPAKGTFLLNYYNFFSLNNLLHKFYVSLSCSPDNLNLGPKDS